MMTSMSRKKTITGAVAVAGLSATAYGVAAVTDGETAPKFSRAQFGPAWADVDHNGCDTRDDILARDLEDVEKTGKCKVTEGDLAKDPYTTLTDISFHDVDIDHMIPLQYVWTHGGASWSADLRKQYANDPRVLYSVSAGANRSKGSSGPAEWKPYQPAWCMYASAWERVAGLYPITLGEDDEDALTMMEQGCQAV